MPRHPPTALSSLSPNKTINKIYKDARVHYTILKQQTTTTPKHQTSRHPDKASSRNFPHMPPGMQKVEVPEPNNVLNPPRTDHPPRSTTTHSKKSAWTVLTSDNHRCRLSVNASTNSHPPCPHHIRMSKQEPAGTQKHHADNTLTPKRVHVLRAP